MNILFSAFQLIIGGNKPALEIFTELHEEQYKTKDNTYQITIEKIDNRFLWIYAQYGGSLPYSDDVVDTRTNEIIENPRKMNHIELNQQLFCLYDSVDYNLYFSNAKKKLFLEGYLKEKCKKDITIKRFFKTPQEFIEQIQTIDKVSFTSKKNIFTYESGLFDNIKDIFGLGEPEDFRIDINFDQKSKTEKFKEVFENFLTKNNNREIHSLVCIGKDDNNVESIFDINNFTQMRTVNCKKDIAGMFESNSVKNQLIEKIKGSCDVH